MKHPLLCTVLTALSCCARADTARLTCTADTNVSSYATEQRFNYGGSSRIRLKGIEMIGLFRFDTRPISAWKITRAELFLRYAGGDRKLRTIGISTISSPWVEGTESAAVSPGGCSFVSAGAGPWALPAKGTDFTDVSFTAGNTMAAYEGLTMHDDGWFSVSVPPVMVAAMLAGDTDGIAVSDEIGQTMANNDVYSREQNGSAPYLVVEGSPQPRITPASAGFTPEPDPSHADVDHGAIRLKVRSAPATFAYNIRYRKASAAQSAWTDLPRSEIPFARPGVEQTITISNLEPAGQYEVELVPVTANGATGVAAVKTSPSSHAMFHPQPLRAPARRIELSLPDRPGAMSVFAYPDTEKASPISGKLLEETAGGDYDSGEAGARQRNAVWDGAGVSLYGARGEILGFQVLIDAGAQGVLKGVQIQPPATWSHGGATRFEPYIALYRDWYVKSKAWYPEACIPLEGAFDIPSGDNHVPGQRNQSIFVDLMIPANAAPGEYTAVFKIAAQGQRERSLPVRLTVNPLTMPDSLSFDISLNTYGTFGGQFGLNDNTPEYRDIERSYHRMAFMHRSTLAPLGYSHTGNTTTNYAPPLEGEGKNLRVSDWSTWDRQFGAYLDGSAFAGLPRKAVPISHLYLPFHEAWPVDIRKHYNYTQTVTEYPAMITEHALTARPIEESTDDDLRDGFRAVAGQFAAHFAQKGWTHTMFQFYQNDKYYYKDPKEGGRGTSWWLLDEPNHRDDWLVLAYFDRLFKEGIGKSPGVNLVRREDISRPQWQRDYLDGLVDLMCVSGELYNKGQRLRQMQDELHVKYWNYGSANPVDRSNTEAEAWAVRAWLCGADAIVPWQTIGEDKNFIEPEETALILPGVRFGVRGPIASLRLKALRRAQQDVEYLVNLQNRMKWNRDQVAAALSVLLRLNGEHIQANDNDAGSYRFGPLRSANFDDVRRAIGSL